MEGTLLTQVENHENHAKSIKLTMPFGSHSRDREFSPGHIASLFDAKTTGL
jgi:hypothetical protein